ncbi:hypothetical protein ES703_14249 [subsurface metagenome]
MKKVLFLVTLIILLLTLVPFDVKASKICFGVKGGMNMSDITGEDVELLEESLNLDLGIKMGMVGGIFLELGLTDMLGVQIEVLYSSKGSKGEFEFLGVEGDMAFNLSYIDIPILLKFKIPIEGPIEPELFIGPSLGYNLSSEIVVEAEGEKETEDLGDETKSIDFGLEFGGGVGYNLGGGKIIIDARYVLGLTSISEYEDEEIKNTNISIRLGYAFPL